MITELPYNYTIDVKKMMKDFIIENEQPFHSNSANYAKNLEVKAYDTFDSILTANQILTDISGFLEENKFGNKLKESFVAVFPSTEIANEAEFDRMFWRLLGLINHYDESEWEGTSARFSDKVFFSMRGEAFDVSAFHPFHNLSSLNAPFAAIAFTLNENEGSVNKNDEDAAKSLRAAAIRQPLN